MDAHGSTGVMIHRADIPTPAQFDPRLHGRAVETTTGQTKMDQAVQVAQRLGEQLHGANERIVTALDRLLGQMPPPPTADPSRAPQAVPNGKWDELDTAVTRLSHLIERTHELAARLETFA